MIKTEDALMKDGMILTTVVSMKPHILMIQRAS